MAEGPKDSMMPATPKDSRHATVSRHIAWEPKGQIRGSGRLHLIGGPWAKIEPHGKGHPAGPPGIICRATGKATCHRQDARAPQQHLCVIDDPVAGWHIDAKIA